LAKLLCVATDPVAASDARAELSCVLRVLRVLRVRCVPSASLSL
jgi:hypothetical protein